ncbi:MAG: hypothetical protein AAF830_01180 [Pseudomonadota bacterium]
MSLVLSTLFLAASVAPCAPPPGWTDAASQALGGALIFGETHGTKEAPAVFAEVVCAAEAVAGPVLVALEISHDEEPALLEAWAAPPERFEAELENALAMWRLPTQDGRSSAAMLAMFKRLHALKQEGRDIDLVAFNRGSSQRDLFLDRPAQEPHESVQAMNIAEASAKRPYAMTLVLVGNIHARKAPMGEGANAWRPMAMILSVSMPVVSLNKSSPAGTSWSCGLKPGATYTPGKPISNDDIQCGPMDSSGSGREGPARIELSDEQAGYDGFFHLESKTASPPAFADQE